MPSFRLRDTFLLVATLAVAFFSACVEEDVEGRVVPIGEKESYALSDTAILYVMTGDTANVQVQFRLDADTVAGTDIQLLFGQTEQAEEFFYSYSSDAYINNINWSGPYLSYSTSNYDGLRRSEVVDIVKGKYVIAGTAPSSEAAPVVEHNFSVRDFAEPADGMYIVISRPLDDNTSLFWSGYTAKPQKATPNVKSEKTPWRLHRAQPLERGANAGRWYIQLADGRYLRRSGNRLAPLALTTCPTRQQATAWNIQQIIPHFNLWTLHTDITGTSDFYGLFCGKNNALAIGVSALDTYSFLSAPVTLQFRAKDEVVHTMPSSWGCYVALPDAAEAAVPDSETTFIGWNTVEGQVEGYLAPGTYVEADNTTYYAIFVKTE